MYYQRGNFEVAAQELERAIDLVDNDPVVIEHLGDVYEKLGKLKDALRVYRDAFAKSEEPEQATRLKNKISATESRLAGLGARL